MASFHFSIYRMSVSLQFWRNKQVLLVFTETEIYWISCGSIHVDREGQWE